MKLTLRPHQEAVLNELRRGWKQHKTHLVYANVGFGKTAVAAAITHGFVSRGLRVLFVAPYTTLVNQTAEKFIEYGLEQPGIIWQNHEWTDPSNPVQIASADTLTRRDMPKVDVMIVDECHIRRKRLLEIIDESDFHTIGLSGTPFAKWMGRHYEQLVKVTTMREMIDAGFLSDFEIFAPTKPNLKGVKTSNLAAYGADYNELQVAEIMGEATIIGDIVSNWLKRGEDEPTICFCVNVKHANHVTNEFNRCGVNAEVMTAETPVEERKMIVKRFEDGITKIICNVGVLVAGFDSDVRCIIYARPTKSEMRWIQCLGRGLRTAPGKERCLIFDHSGTVLTLGFPDQIEYDKLVSENDGLKQQQAQKEKEKREKKPKECSKCNFMKPAGVYICPKCGHKPLAGEDVEVDDTRELERLNGKEKKWTMEEKQSWYSMFLGQCKTKGYKEGWAANKYKEKFGVWPKGLKRIPKAASPEFNAYIKHLNIKFAKSKKAKSYRAEQEQLLGNWK